MNEYKDLLLELEWCAENQETRAEKKKAVKKEWRFRTRESVSLQADLTDLEAPIPELKALQMWDAAGNKYEEMHGALNRLRTENNIMAIRRVRYGMMRVCKTYLHANSHGMSQVEEEIILCADEYLSNPDEE